jgi:nucleoside-diphosphate-sugar epimerase
MTETILVTGACGFTGSNMLEYLAEEYPGAEVVATDLPGSDRAEYYTEAPGSDNPQPVYYGEIIDDYDVEFIEGDLTEPDDVKRIADTHEYDTVYNIASLYDYFAPREALYSVNVDGTRNLLSALVKQETTLRLVHWSTLGVLGDAGFDEPKSEGDGYHPENRYCESKVVQEQIVKTFADRIDTTVIRPAPIYGPRHQYGIYNVLSVIENAGFAPVFKNYPRRYQRRFPCAHVDDVIGAADYLASQESAIGETYNVLSDPIEADEMTEFLGEELGRRSVTIPMPEPLYRLTASVSYSLALRAEKRARANDERPLVEAPTIRYVTGNMWFSNQKLKDSGYDLRYEDAKDGLRDYIGWCRDNGYLESRTEECSRTGELKQSVQQRLPTLSTD